MMKFEKNQKYWMVAYGLAAILAHFSTALLTKILCLSFIFYTAAFLPYMNPYLLYLSVSIVFSSVESPAAILFATLPVYVNKSLFNLRLSNKQVLALIALFVFSMTSYQNGINPTLSTMLVFYSCVLVFVEMLQKRITLHELYMYVLLMFFVIVFIEAGELLSGTLTIRFGRLAIYDNIRKLANAIAIPTFFSFAMLSLPQKSIRKRNLYLIVGGVSSFILFLTLSKGALIATVVGLAVVFLFPKGRRSFRLSSYLFPLLVIALVFLIVQYAESHFGMFHFDRLLAEDEGFSGRTDIWEDYFQYMRQNSTLLFFGFGPGDLKRLSLNGFYAHSLFLDAFFSYGIMMSVLLLLVLVHILFRILSSQSTMAIGIFVFTCLLFSTHGNITYVPFYILLVIAYQLATEDIRIVRNM